MSRTIQINTAHMVDITMIADRLGVPANRIRGWKNRGVLPGGDPFPDPIVELSKSTVYDFRKFGSVLD